MYIATGFLKINSGVIQSKWNVIARYIYSLYTCTVTLLLFIALFPFLGICVLFTRYPNNIPGPRKGRVQSNQQNIYEVRWHGFN